MEKYLLILLSIPNLITFILFGIDKSIAKWNNNPLGIKRRISEKKLLTSAALFGAIGGLLGMIIFRHKIRKNKFWILMVLFLVGQVGGLWFVT